MVLKIHDIIIVLNNINNDYIELFYSTFEDYVIDSKSVDINGIAQINIESVPLISIENLRVFAGSMYYDDSLFYLKSPQSNKIISFTKGKASR